MVKDVKDGLSFILHRYTLAINKLQHRERSEGCFRTFFYFLSFKERNKKLFLDFYQRYVLDISSCISTISSYHNNNII